MHTVESVGHFASADTVVTFANAKLLPRLRLPSVVVQSAEILKGGGCNRVYRIRFASSPSSLQTAIFKYYPPFLSAQESVPLTSDRYFVEKEALLLAKRCVKELGTVINTPGILVADDDLKVLVMEDAGEDIVSLMDYFALNRPQGVPPHHPTPSALVDQLCTFLTSLYQLDPQQASPLFHNPAIWGILNDHVVSNFANNIDRLGVSQQLSKWVPLATPIGPPAENAVLIMGDLWPNSVYFSPASGNVWLLDWEGARFGDKLSDTRQMVTNLYLMESSPHRFRVEDVRMFRKELVEQMKLRTGRQPGVQEHVDFLVLLAAIVNNEFWKFDDAGAVLCAAANDVESVLS